MEKDFAPFIKDYLGSGVPLQPEPAGISAILNQFNGIKAVLFDIYGTLLISASGDIDSTQFLESNLLTCLDNVGIHIRYESSEEAAQRIIQRFIETIREIHEEKKQLGIPYPEVDIIEVWKRVITHSEEDGIIRFPGEVDIEHFALLFELTNNPVHPMPGMNEIIEYFDRSGILLGIISNAQFYTPIILNYFISGIIQLLDTVQPFKGDLTFFSYRYLRAKPDSYLYTLAKKNLASYNCMPEQTIYVGNDIVKDIIPASQAGFKTILFAGDRRSLRWKRNTRESSCIDPDAVITHLTQLFEIINVHP
jgi:putative hydrolase of the HAD superfamily